METYVSSSRNFGSLSGYGEQCCEQVVDPISLLTVIGAIAGLTWFMRQAVIDNMIMAGRKRKRSISYFVFHGNIWNLDILFCQITMFIKFRVAIFFGLQAFNQ